MPNSDTTPKALVTGGSGGLGRATAIALAHAGVDPIITYRSGKDEADAVVSDVADLGATATALQLDTTDVDAFPAFVEELAPALGERGRLDVLVNMAGTGVNALIAETTRAQLEQMLAVHVVGPFLLTQALLGALADGASIVNISSGLTGAGGPGFAAYASAKGAVEVMTRYMAMELGDRGITVNTIAPGATATPFGGGALQDPKVQEHLTARNAIPRMGQPDDIGEAIAALVTSRSRWITGQRIEVSGGRALAA